MKGVLRFLARAVAMMLARGVIKAIDDDGGMQRLQLDLLPGETKTGVERFQEYGFTSHPLPGAGALAAFLGGNRDRGLVVAVDDRRYRLKGLAQGEVALYTDEGQSVHLKRGQEIHLIAGTSSIVMTPAGITITTPAIDFVKAV